MTIYYVLMYRGMEFPPYCRNEEEVRKQVDALNNGNGGEKWTVGKCIVEDSYKPFMNEDYKD